MARIEPGEETFDPQAFGPAACARALERGVALFDEGAYHEAHEELERCWLADEAGDADFFKGLIQACICLHHLERGNREGARPLYTGHRRLLGPYLPAHRGVDLARFLAEMRTRVAPALGGSDAGPGGARPRMGPLPS